MNVVKKNAAKDPDQDLNIRKDPFIVYLIWSKKNCGPNFINAMGGLNFLFAFLKCLFFRRWTTLDRNLRFWPLVRHERQLLLQKG